MDLDLGDQRKVNESKTDRVDQVVERGLCTGCGTCVSMCPRAAIKMQIRKATYLPEINLNHCTLCRICVKSCPGYLVDFEMLNSRVFGKQPNDMLLGNCVRCYFGYSANENIRYCSSSGGIATQLLIFALDQKLIDGALVVRMRRDNPLKPEIFIARTKEEVVSASKSKYCPVATNTGLKEILRQSGKFGVVGLPCHIHGLRKAEMLNKALKEKIVFRIGLFCSHSRDFEGTEFILKKIKVDKSNVEKLDYRGRGWPGGMTLTLKDGSERFIPLHEYYSILGSWLFTPWRCILCGDATNEFADISLGDAWIPEFRHDQKGTSVIVTRSMVGEGILRKAAFDRKIIVRETDTWAVIRSQKSILDFKREA